MKKLGFLLVLFLFVTISGVSAQPTPQQEKEIGKAWEEIEKVQVAGPRDIALGEQGMLHLPKDFLYVPKAQANRLMKSIGNGDDQDMIGMILPENPDEDWFIIIDYIKSGYIKDDDAKNWDIEELLTSIKEGTEEGNKRRKEKGFTETEIVGWVEKPQYDAANKRLIWSIAAKDKGKPVKANAQTINYNTYVLGREGYLNLSLVTDLGSVEAQKPMAAQILAATEFVKGKRYEDFDSSTDKVAEYGLATLVAGVAAKKLGFFAMMAAFGLKFAKVIGVAVVAGGALLMKLRGKKKEEAPTDEQRPPEA